MSTPDESERRGAPAARTRTGVSCGETFAVAIPTGVVGVVFGELWNAAQHAAVGVQFAYAGLAFGLSALSAVGTVFLLNVPDSRHARLRRTAAQCLLGPSLLPPMFGSVVFASACAQALHMPLGRTPALVLGLVVWLVWGIALFVPLLRFSPRRRLRTR